MKSTFFHQSTMNLSFKPIYGCTLKFPSINTLGQLPLTDKRNHANLLSYAVATKPRFVTYSQSTQKPFSNTLKKGAIKSKTSSCGKNLETYLADSFSSFPLLKNCAPVFCLETAYDSTSKLSPILPLVDKINGRLCQQEKQSRLFPTPESQRPLTKKDKPGTSQFEKKRKTLFYNKSHIATLSIQSTRNNTLLTLSGSRGKVLKGGWVSAGSLGFKNSRKSTAYASQAAAKSLALRARRLGIRALHLKLQGTGRAKGAVVRTLRKSSLKVLVIRECTAALHNGCRRPKKRRI